MHPRAEKVTEQPTLTPPNEDQTAKVY